MDIVCRWWVPPVSLVKKKKGNPDVVLLMVRDTFTVISGSILTYVMNDGTLYVIPLHRNIFYLLYLS